jgi:hypothetical protein
MILIGQSLIFSQTPPGQKGPSPVLWIYREDVKVARGIVHNRVERGYAQFWAKAQIALHASSVKPNCWPR